MSVVTDYMDSKKIVSGVKDAASSAKDFVRETADIVGHNIGVGLSGAKERLSDAQDVVFDRTKAAATATDQYVHDNPWPSIGIAAAIGLLVGIIIGRR